MLQRLKTAIPLILVVSLVFLLPGCYGSVLFSVLALAMLGAALHECFTMTNLLHGRLFQACAMFFGSLLFIFNAVQTPATEKLFGSLTLLAVSLFIMSVFLLVFKYGPTVQMTDGALSALGFFLYVCWSLYYMDRIYFLPAQNGVDGRHILLFMIAVTKMADVGAYFAGSLTAKLPGGNHKLSKAVSPKKSWEGLAGGILFSAGTAWGLSSIPWMLDFDGAPIINVWEAIAFGVLSAIIGLVGDLAESAIKRAHNFKDSGSIPGIGGIMDVLDSLLPVAPLFYAFLSLK